jgi:hypothetical protein
MYVLGVGVAGGMVFRAGRDATPLQDDPRLR